MVLQPYLRTQLEAARDLDLRRRAARERRRPSRRDLAAVADVVIRLSTACDRAALAALATLDETVFPAGRTLVAEVDGTLRAALPLDGGRPFADPFSATAELVDLLELRARQLVGTRRHRRFGGLAFR